MSRAAQRCIYKEETHWADAHNGLTFLPLPPPPSPRGWAGASWKKNLWSIFGGGVECRWPTIDETPRTAADATKIWESSSSCAVSEAPIDPTDTPRLGLTPSWMTPRPGAATGPDAAQECQPFRPLLMNYWLDMETATLQGPPEVFLPGQGSTTVELSRGLGEGEGVINQVNVA